jgi:hypothetical protein
VGSFFGNREKALGGRVIGRRGIGAFLLLVAISMVLVV